MSDHRETVVGVEYGESESGRDRPGSRSNGFLLSREVMRDVSKSVGKVFHRFGGVWKIGLGWSSAVSRTGVEESGESKVMK